MKIVKSAKGKSVDMGALAAQNEEVRAVGTTPMNARGDRLGGSGNIVVPAKKIAGVQNELKEPAEVKPMSKATKTKSKAAKKATPIVMSEEIKTRKDGSKYIEIEYDDGSLEEKEIENGDD